MKTLATKIQIRPELHEYTVQTRQRCKWCWLLLLLLLPLLLLIPLEKDISIKLIDIEDNSIIPNQPVNFQYRKRAVFDFDSLRFFANYYPIPTPALQKSSNSDGIVIFKNVKYNVYQWFTFWAHKNDFVDISTENECFGADSTYLFFNLKEKKVHELYVSAARYDMEFTVVDADDNNEILPGALVRIESDRYGIVASDTSDNAGRVVFKQIPKCSHIVVIGSKYGWYNDTITGEANKIYQIEDTLFLKQEKVIVKFFARDLNTEKPLVDAHGQLFFQDNPTQQVGDNAITNINGLAKGVFENVHKIRKIRIDVNTNNNLTFYNDTTTQAYLNYITVEQWNGRSDADKIIYLRPKPQPIQFQNTDCKTNAGLSNIKNTVRIKKSDGTTLSPTPPISDSNGYFSVSAGIGDTITIESHSDRPCPNEYLPNTTTIVNAAFDDLKDNAAKRKIPLCPKAPPKVKFRNIDADTRVGVSGVTNTIKVQGGATITKRSDASGWFEISEVFECQIISVKADGSSVGYGINDTTIRNRDYSQLMPPAPQTKRDIPLKLDKVCVKFRNVDRCDNTPISGIVNNISIPGSQNQSKISGSNGIFEVCAESSKRISITSQNMRYNAYRQIVNGQKSLQELSQMPQPIDLPMEMKGEIGKLNFRIIWDKRVDIDFRITDPNGQEVDSHETLGKRYVECPCGGKRDIDNTAGGPNSIENIFWQNPPSGKYKVEIQMHTGRISTPVTVIVRANCETRTFRKTLTQEGVDVYVGEIRYPLR